LEKPAQREAPHYVPFTNHDQIKYGKIGAACSMHKKD
jgi:hypothetical protein